MANESLKLARLQRQREQEAAVVGFLESLVKNPIVHGMAALELNHAIYKKGWYDANAKITVPSGGLSGLFGGTTTITPAQAAGNMHDSIAAWIMLCTTAEAIAPLLPTISSAAQGVIKAVGSV